VEQSSQISRNEVGLVQLEKNPQTNLQRLSVSRKLIFGMGGAADCLMSNMIIQLWAGIYVIALGISPLLIGLAMGIPRVLDAATDPLIGNISDNTRTRWGRRRPYILLGGGITAVLFFLLWMAPKEWGEYGIFAYVFVCLFLYFLSYALFSVPYSALSFELSTDYNERTEIQGYRTIMALVACLIMPWAYKLCFFFGDKNLKGSDVELSGLTWVALLYGGLMLITAAMPAIFTKENLEVQKQEKISFIKSVKMTIRNKPLRYLMGIIFMAIAANLAIYTLLPFINIYFIYNGDKSKGAMMYGLFTAVSAGVGAVSTPAMIWCAKHLGKKITLLIGQIIIVSGFAMSWFLFNPSYPYLQLVLAVMLAPTFASIWTLLSSMLADVTDIDEVDTGLRREGMYGAVYSWTYKASIALATIAAGFVISITGIKPELEANQTHEAIVTLRVLFALVPALCIVVAFLITSRCPLTKQRAYEVRAILEKRKKSIDGGI